MDGQLLNRYVDRIVEIVYMDRSGMISQRRIKIHKAEGERVLAYCFKNRAPRSFKTESIFAISIPSRKWVG